MTTVVKGNGPSGRSSHSCRTDRRTHRISDSHVVTVIDSRAGGATLARRLAPVGGHLLERIGMPPGEAAAAHV